MFSEQDKRRDATCWVIAEDVEYTKRYQDTHIWLQKYRPYDKNFKQSSGDQNLNYNNNYRYYRYAETLLNAAELSLRTGGSSTGEAKTWLNEVRTRAGLAELASVTVDDVLTERHLEFVGEGKRYFDLVRAEGISGASSKTRLLLHLSQMNMATVPILGLPRRNTFLLHKVSWILTLLWFRMLINSLP